MCKREKEKVRDFADVAMRLFTSGQNNPLKSELPGGGPGKFPRNYMSIIKNIKGVIDKIIKTCILSLKMYPLCCTRQGREKKLPRVVNATLGYYLIGEMA